MKMNRRQFLTCTAAVGAVGLPSCSTLESSAIAPCRLRLSTSSIHFKELSIEKACEQIARLGFEGVDIWCAYDKCPHLDDVAARLGPDGLKALLARHKLKLFSFSVYIGGYAKYAELLGRAGGGVAIQGSAAPCKPAELTAKMKAFLEELKPLIELAEKQNSYLAIENHGNALLDSPDSFKAFTDLNRSPRLGLALAPYHLQAIGAPVDEVIRIAGRQLFFFYAWQKQDGLNQLPGHGPADFKPWLKVLADADYRGYVNPFMHGHLESDAMAAALSKSCAYLRQQATPAWKISAKVKPMNMHTDQSLEKKTVMLGAGLAAAATTVAFADPATVDKLVAGLQSTDDAVRGAAWQGAATLGAPAVKSLSGLMNHPNFEIARAAKRALWKIVRHSGRPNAGQERKPMQTELLALLETAPVPVRREAVRMLSEIGDKAVIEPLAAWLTNAELREDARCALERIPLVKATRALQKAFATVPDEFRPAVANSLRARGCKVAGYPSQKLTPTKQTSVVGLTQPK